MSDAAGETRDLAAAYALGALDVDEARAFEALLAGSAEARAEVAEYREVAALLSLGADGAGLPVTLRARVLASAPASPAPVIPISSARQRPGIGRLMPWLAAAAALALAFAFWNGEQLLRRQIVASDSVRAERERALARRDATLDALLAPGVEMIQLTASGEAAPGMQLFLDRARGLAVIHAFRLPPAAAGRTYQLWFIRGGATVPSITFNSGTDGQALIERVSVPAGAVSAAAVTEEPTGGSGQPTTTPFLIGTIGES